MPNLNTSILSALPFVLPPLEEQRAIAHILGTLDDKIELNRRMNETLEAMARAIFKSWFVDFDPVRAKASGEPTESICRRLGLTPDVLALFPNSFQDSELGEIPAGWPIRFVGELCDRIAMGPFGSNIKTSNFVPTGVPVIRGGNLPNGFVDDRFVFLTEEKADQLRNSNARPGDIVITHRGTLGQVGLIPSDSQYPRYVVSQSQMVLSVRSGVVSSRYLYEFLRSQTGQQALLANTSQVGVPAIAQPTTSVKAIRLIAPPVTVLRAYGMATQSLFDQASAAAGQSSTLTGLRNSLLPKLLSGELPTTIQGTH
jgi:type I restriction enzyme S subunit